MKILPFLVCVALLVAGCTPEARLTVVNESTTTLTNVVVFGYTFTNAIPPLAPGTQQHVALESDSGNFTLEFDASGKHYTEPSPRDPWRGIKENIMTVSTNFSVACDRITIF